VLTAAGVTVMSYDALAQAGAAKPVDAVGPKPDDYCTIMYTSGTTGTHTAMRQCRAAVDAGQGRNGKHWRRVLRHARAAAALLLGVLVFV
jgi:long-chain acyl-CoA synthetase